MLRERRTMLGLAVACLFMPSRVHLKEHLMKKRCWRRMRERAEQLQLQVRSEVKFHSCFRFASPDAHLAHVAVADEFE